MYYNDVLKGLQNSKIRYLVVGGLAVNLHGVPRTTQDVDLIISLDKDNVKNLCRLMKYLGYVPRLPVDPMSMADQKILEDWTKNRNMTAFSFYHRKENYKVVDIVLVQPLNFNEAYQRKIVLNAGNMEVCLVSLEDLIKMKISAGRPRDLSDAEMLKEAKDIGENGDA